MKRTKKMLWTQYQAQYLQLLDVVPTLAVHNTLQCLTWKQIVGLLPLVPREQDNAQLPVGWVIYFNIGASKWIVKKMNIFPSSLKILKFKCKWLY
ncbi:mCG145695 [Mus musculus]|nr:mCG145695 [Mus musculus]